MRTWLFTIALGPKLVALVASTTDPAPNRRGFTGAIPVQFGLPPLAAGLQITVFIVRVRDRLEDRGEMLSLRGDHIGPLAIVVVVGVAIVGLWGNAGQHDGQLEQGQQRKVLLS
jgi:hypothetical protein